MYSATDFRMFYQSLLLTPSCLPYSLNSGQCLFKYSRPNIPIIVPIDLKKHYRLVHITKQELALKKIHDEVTEDIFDMNM